ncbi:methyltransferase domain-containing protein [bacterium SCSIO 12741]|nr:methyltransferase domain-containing protein [bacterium SCSIO 12741]
MKTLGDKIPEPKEGMTPQELAKQLRQPEGDLGKKVAEVMNQGNEHITRNAYQLLKAQDGEQILEIGMGNGFYIPELLSQSENLSYTGADFSATMVEEAQRLNNTLVDQQRVRFVEASIEKLPFAEHSFDVIVSTNTLYFWPQPLDNAKELLRVLKPGGRIVNGYRDRDCLEQMEATNYGFSKYDRSEVEKLFRDAGFREVSTEIIDEPDREFAGEVMHLTGFYTLGLK